MTLRTATLGLAIAALGTSAFAFDLDSVKTRVLNGLEGPSGANNISNVAIANAPLADEGLDQIAGYNLRTRSWTISADTGIVPIHSHVDRPAIVYTLTGEIYEYRSDASDRIRHSAGGLSLEEGDVTHWWLNEGPEDVRLIAFDVFNAGGDTTVMSDVPTQQAFDLPAQSGAVLELLGLVDIEAHYDGAQGDGLALSTYRAVIEPGGVLPSFVAAGEPLQVWVWQGAVTEHRSDAAAPVTLVAEEGAHLGGGAQAYWENTGDVPAELFFGVVEPITETEGVPQVGVQAHHGG
ncbi:cupin domain-containing protein [uncultured Tateyamaria sp.]|uniref:cupin domain-containing protein n=1 Tax=uncultured Tateyamaria sp. TaxID=455651 RepID=UPI00261F939A|nr:cupin domain-containing protein [uncultured Tateyamaria sp.]